MKEENPEKLISLREAAKYCDYSQGYLAFLVRQGKLKAKRVGKIWATTKKWLNECLTKIKK